MCTRTRMRRPWPRSRGLLSTPLAGSCGTTGSKACHEPLVLLSETGRAAAVMTTGVDGLPYLDKFIVTSQAQGEGLGAAVWQVVTARYPALYWRSRNTNPVTPWYFQQADSSIRSGAMGGVYHWYQGRAERQEHCVS